MKTKTEILDEDHYGLKDVKDRILEFIAVGKLKGVKCFVRFICLVFFYYCFSFGIFPLSFAYLFCVLSVCFVGKLKGK
jgi:hypothetical protein